MAATLLHAVVVIWMLVGLTCGIAPTLIVTTKKGIYHLDADGKLLNYGNQTGFKSWQKGHVATNPRNGTVCWVSSPKEHDLTGIMRCASIEDLDASWDLPKPKNIRVKYTEKMEIDPDLGHFYMTIAGKSYVCSYDFQYCAKIQQKTDSVRTLVAYDIPNRLIFFITYEDYSVRPPRKSYIMEVMNLDGSGRHQITDNSSIFFPSAVDIDFVEKKIYTLDRSDIYHRELYQLNYSGDQQKLLTKFERQWGAKNKRDMKLVGDSIYVMWGNQQNISRVDKNTGEITHLVKGKLKQGVIEKDLADEPLLSLNVYSEDLQPRVENSCLKSKGGCGDICVPTVTSGAATHTCFCPPGQELVDTGCFNKEPAFIIVVQKEALHALDITNEVPFAILSGLTDATKVDFFYNGAREYILFWVSDGGLFRGLWVAGGEVEEVETLVPAGKMKKVIDVAVDWNQKNVIWMEHDTELGREDSAWRMKVASVFGDAHKTIAEDLWLDQSTLMVIAGGIYFGYQQQFNDSTRAFQERNMRGENKSFLFAFNHDSLKVPYKIHEFADDPSAISEYDDERYFWVDPVASTIEVTYTNYLPIISGSRTLLQHNSLMNTAGMDVLNDRIFWLDGSAGVLMTADSRNGENIQPFGPSEQKDRDWLKAVRSIKVLHPRKQPRSKFDKICNEDKDGCSDICLKIFEGSERRGMCACTDGKMLRDDGKTCE